MGYFSYDCKECGHPLLSPEASDEGINNWMTHGVALFEDGGRAFGTYDGYGRLGSTEELEGAACLHRACWEKAGEPEFDHYGSGSQSAGDQGFFFDDGDHDVIDPRITENREQILAEGVAKREKRRFDHKAQEVRRWIKDGPIDEKEPAWTQRFRVSHKFSGRAAIRGQWVMHDRDYEFFQADETRTFHGTEEEAHALCAKLWDEFVASDKCKAYLARAEELRIEGLKKYAADLRSKGRYEVSYGSSRKGGDTVGNGNPCSRSLYYVSDRLTFERVAIFDFEGENKHFESDIYYEGNHSPEWEARVEENRADERARRAKAEAEAQRLEAEWAAQGKPITFDGEVL